MKLYFAPMEGINGYIYRQAFQKYFNHVDNYFLPFIAPNQNRSMTTKEMNDILPENNQAINAVPQILANQSEYFLKVVHILAEKGYKEVNLNLGCPSPTVVTKGKGAGFLAQLDKLNQFLSEIFEKSPLQISIKTRLSIDNPHDWHDLFKIYNDYPMKELIVHPRTQKEFYRLKPHLDVFEEIYHFSKHPLIYNGDIFHAEDFRQIQGQFPLLKGVMLGRGIITNPQLPQAIKKGEEERCLKTFAAFHQELLIGYKSVLCGDQNVLYKMKEFWFYFHRNFENADKAVKKIRKAQNIEKYEEAVNEIFENHDWTDRRPSFI